MHPRALSEIRRKAGCKRLLPELHLSRTLGIGRGNCAGYTSHGGTSLSDIRMDGQPRDVFHAPVGPFVQPGLHQAATATSKTGCSTQVSPRLPVPTPSASTRSSSGLPQQHLVPSAEQAGQLGPTPAARWPSTATYPPLQQLPQPGGDKGSQRGQYDERNRSPIRARLPLDVPIGRVRSFNLAGGTMAGTKPAGGEMVFPLHEDSALVYAQPLGKTLAQLHAPFNLSYAELRPALPKVRPPGPLATTRQKLSPPPCPRAPSAREL